MTKFDQASISGGTTTPVLDHGQGVARHGNWTLLWFGLALVAATLLLAALGGTEHRVPGPPSVTVGAAMHTGDAA